MAMIQSTSRLYGPLLKTEFPNSSQKFNEYWKNTQDKARSYTQQNLAKKLTNCHTECVAFFFLFRAENRYVKIIRK